MSFRWGWEWHETRRDLGAPLVGRGSRCLDNHDSIDSHSFWNHTATSAPKTARGNRTIAIGPVVAASLKAWKRSQTADRLLVGSLWQDSAGLVVTNVDGSAPNPEAFSNLFGKLVRAAGLPVIRLHDVRHSCATAALAAGVPAKTLSQRIGHADVGVPLAVYAHVMPGDDEDAARRADSLLADS